MGRAPNQGAPQRVSAHVVPKAPAFSGKAPGTAAIDDEEEKTTIESGWEEEASTTVDQGDVAEKVRSAIAFEPARRQQTGITATSGNALDEPTVDDQHANAGLSLASMPSIVTPPALMARLVITAGNDTGQQIEIVPGKTYTIGRAIDNDVVLTDIAVSRKHFDLRHENGAWVVVDRGSGNGTLVNGNLEDQPFMLANGDSIEIGNTTFRFEGPNTVPRNAFAENRPTTELGKNGVAAKGTPSPTYDVDVDDEPSTVAGKPLRPSQSVDTPVRDVRPLVEHERALEARAGLETRAGSIRSERAPERPVETPQVAPPPPRAGRPRTVPPPAPLPRPRPPTNAPQAYPVGSQGSLAAAMAPTVSPHQGMAAMQPPSGARLAQPSPSQPPPPLQPAPPLVLPQQRPPVLGAQQPTMLGDAAIPSLANHAHANQPLQNVMPTTLPGQGPPMQQHQPLPFTYPNVADHHQHAQHAKMYSINASGQRDATSTAHVQPSPFNGLQSMGPYGTARPSGAFSRRTKLVLGGASLTLFAAVLTVVIIKLAAGGDDTSEAPEATPTTTTPTKPTVQPIDAAKPPAKVEPKVDPKSTIATKVDPKTTTTTTKVDPKPDPKTAQVPIIDPKSVPDPKTAKTDPKTTTTTTTKVDPKPDPKTTPTTTAKVDPKPDPKTTPTTTIAKVDPKPDPKTTPKVDPKKDRRDPKKDRPPTTTTPRTPKVATIDTSSVKDKAEGLFRAKKFNDAAGVLRASAANASGSDASDLKNLAGAYENFGRSYNRGMAPTTLPAESWTSLNRALSFDSSGYYREEINRKLSEIAARAATGFVGQGNYAKALEAVRVAERNGKTGTTSIVRSKIEDYAGELYAQAVKEQDSNPKEARSKFLQVKALVEPKSPWYAKAQQKLAN